MASQSRFIFLYDTRVNIFHDFNKRIVSVPKSGVVACFFDEGGWGSCVWVMGTLLFALIGGFWYLWALDYNLSVAVAVGFIALAGVAAEFGVIMLVYLDNAVTRYRQQQQLNTRSQLKSAILEGAVQRVRPKAMTVAVIIAGLIPIMLSTGSDVMQRIAAPMIGGMITAPLLSLFVMPVVYWLWLGRGLEKG